MTDDIKPTGLDLLRQPFPAHLISKLPKPTKKQTDDVKADYTKGIRCQLCGAWHHKDVVHLDYVGHAALTDRLLDCDPNWDWQPMGLVDGLPLCDSIGGLWIKLTVCGVTRLGYGSADGKTGGDAIKEIIGDALRNAAMRFGAALDLWHKGDLHLDDKPEQEKAHIKQDKSLTPKEQAALQEWIDSFNNADELKVIEDLGKQLAKATMPEKAKAELRIVYSQAKAKHEVTA